MKTAMLIIECYALVGFLLALLVDVWSVTRTEFANGGWSRSKTSLGVIALWPIMVAGFLYGCVLAVRALLNGESIDE